MNEIAQTENVNENLEPSERIDERPKRREFPNEYKVKVLREIEESRDERGAVGKILRREGLYASQVSTWKEDLENLIAGLPAKKRGPKIDPNKETLKENEKLEKENKRLTEKLRQATLIIEAQKKISAMFDISEEKNMANENKVQ
jgi:transposase-like protein